MDRTRVTSALGRTPAFSGLSSEQLDHLTGSCAVRRFQPGEMVFSRGDPSGGMFVVASGSVALIVNAASGHEVVLAVLGPPKSFGELAVIDGGPRVATALVRTPTVLVSVPRTEARRLLRDEPTVTAAILGLLTGLVRAVDDHVADLVLLDLASRLAKFLLAATAAPMPHSDAPVRVDVSLSQTEMARLLGGSRQQVNRIIGEFATGGAIERSGGRITAIRPRVLTAWLESR